MPNIMLSRKNPTAANFSGNKSKLHNSQKSSPLLILLSVIKILKLVSLDLPKFLCITTEFYSSYISQSPPLFEIFGMYLALAPRLFFPFF